ASHFSTAMLAERVPFQIHKFIDFFQDPIVKQHYHYVSDWVVAERLLVGRGESLGREKVEVELVEWNKQKGMFEIGSISTAGVKKNPKAAPISAVSVDFRPPNPIVLLDFWGGKRFYKQPKTGENMPNSEESATEAPLLMPDGTMIVRNSRNDMSDLGWQSKQEEGAGGHPLGQQRHRRWDYWRNRLELVRQSTTAPVMPPGGMPGGMVPGGGGAGNRGGGS